MLYAIIAQDVDDSLERRTAARPGHLDHVRALLAEGRLIFAGPHPRVDAPDPGPAGYSGSLIVAEFDSLEEAQEWVASDPYSIAGVFSNVQVKPVVQTLP